MAEFSDHFPNCICFNGRDKLFYIVLLTFLLGFFNSFSCFFSKLFEEV